MGGRGERRNRRKAGEENKDGGGCGGEGVKWRQPHDKSEAIEMVK